jgi:hypothetical protein
MYRGSVLEGFISRGFRAGRRDERIRAYLFGRIFSRMILVALMPGTLATSVIAVELATRGLTMVKVPASSASRFTPFSVEVGLVAHVEAASFE